VVQKVWTTTAWDSRVNSAESYRANAYLSFSPATSGWFIMGLSEAPTTTVGFSQLNYAFSCNSGSLSIYEVGFEVNTYGSYSIGDSLQILWTSSAIQYFLNGTLLRSVPRSVGNPLFMSCCINTGGTAVEAIDFHPIYQMTGAQPALSTSSFLATTSPLAFSFAPFYLTLTSDLPPSVWAISCTSAGATTASLYADVYINTIKTYTTNLLSNLSISSPSTYLLNFSIPTAYYRSPGDTLSIQVKGTKSVGDLYVYTNWLGTPSLSSIVSYSQPNPNAVDTMEFFHTSPTGLQTSELAVYISEVSTNTLSYVNSSNGLFMNKSYMVWNSALNGITIQNRYNDTSTRSLTYTGALYNASDPQLKDEIEMLDPIPYMNAIKDLPLHRYAFSDSYCSTFRTRDRQQLGVLTSELPFSSMVQSAPFDFCGFSTIQTVDRTQFRYAHLAATQGLLLRLSTLKGKLGTV
jgi:hypothetical protein